MSKALFLAISIGLGSLTASSITVDQAVDSLYSRMSLPDSLDYSYKFFEDNARMSLKAKATMPWGNEISDTLFLISYYLYAPTTKSLTRAARYSITNLPQG